MTDGNILILHANNTALKSKNLKTFIKMKEREKKINKQTLNKSCTMTVVSTIYIHFKTFILIF